MCAAALAAARLRRRVVLTEETHWLGCQLTNQAVPPDERPWIEEFGATATYRALREGMRDHYRDDLPRSAEARALKASIPSSWTYSFERARSAANQPGFRPDRRTTRVVMICSILGNAF